MKTLLKNKIGWALVLAVLMSLFLVSNCTSDPGTGRTTTTTTTTTGGTTSSERESKLACELPSCSGTCCEDDKDCKDLCKKSLSAGKSLGINSSSARDKCYAMGKEDVEKLVEITKKLHKPSEKDLAEIGGSEESMNLLCAAVSKLEHEILEDRINDFTSSNHAKRMLGWIAETETTYDVFVNAEDDEGVDMFKKLLRKAGDGSNDVEILNGLLKEVETDDTNGVDRKSETYFMRWALSKGNTDIVKWVHEEIIGEEGLCKGDNLPVPVADNGVSDNSEYGTAACLLGVYCKMASDNNSEDNDFRENIAENIGGDRNDVDNLIEATEDKAATGSETKVYGGLGRSESEAEAWNLKACCKLDENWNDGSLGLDLDDPASYGTCSGN